MKVVVYYLDGEIEYFEIPNSNCYGIDDSFVRINSTYIPIGVINKGV